MVWKEKEKGEEEEEENGRGKENEKKTGTRGKIHRLVGLPNGQPLSPWLVSLINTNQ